MRGPTCDECGKKGMGEWLTLQLENHLARHAKAAYCTPQCLVKQLTKAGYAPVAIEAGVKRDG